MTRGRAILYVATGIGLALIVRALWGAPLPLWFAVGALVGYVGVVVLGVLSPTLEMFASIANQGDEDARGIALTFDDGPHAVHTRAVLCALEAAGARATFFVLGHKARAHPDVVREIAARGHLVGIHGDSHDRLLSLRSSARVQRDLARAVASIEAITGERPRFYRPPVGQTNPRIAKAAADLGLTIVGWSVRARDGVRAAPTKVVSRVVPALRNGAVVLLHDAAERDDRVPAAPLALPEILAAMHSRGFTSVRVDAWFRPAPASDTAAPLDSDSRSARARVGH